MKHIWRKPLLPTVLVAVILLGIVFMGMFRQSINEDKKTIDEMYLNTDLTFSVLPGINSNGALEFPISDGNKIEALEEVRHCFYYEACYYSLREPLAIAGLSMIYGTNDIVSFKETQKLEITWKEDYDITSFQVLEDGKVPCVADSLLLESMGLQFGDTIVIAASEGDTEDNEKAAAFTLEIVGSYVSNEGTIFPYGLITTNRIFLSSEGRLLYNANMMEKFCFYRAFVVEIEPIFNREFERIEEELNEIIGEDYILYSNIRVLKQAVRPLEQKVALQEKLVLPLSMLFVLASCVVAYLTTISFQTEVFLRLLWGEKRWVVFGKMTASLCPHLLLTFLIGGFLAWEISGGSLDGWLIGYLIVEVAACLCTAAVANFIVSRQNLIKTYQAREE